MCYESRPAFSASFSEDKISSNRPHFLRIMNEVLRIISNILLKKNLFLVKKPIQQQRTLNGWLVTILTLKIDYVNNVRKKGIDIV